MTTNVNPSALPNRQSQERRSRAAYLGRIASVYLFPGRSPLAFWHETPELNERAISSALEEYYMTFRGKADYRGPFDADGVPMLDYRGDIGVQHNPIAIAQYGLARLNRFRGTGTEDDRTSWVAAARWLARHLEPNGHGVRVWMHHFAWPYRRTLIPPWYSGLAQGVGVSLLTRAAQETAAPDYADSATRAFAALTCDVSEGGVLVRDGGARWIEEYLVDPPSHILNGFIWALWGVRDFAVWSRDLAAHRLFDELTATLAANLHRYDTGYWSLYELSDEGPPMLASAYYHALHITQLRVMYRLTGQPVFRDTAERWRAYMTKRRFRTRAFVEKAWFKVRHY